MAETPVSGAGADPTRFDTPPASESGAAAGASQRASATGGAATAAVEDAAAEAASRKRPLYAKLELLLDLMFRCERSKVAPQQTDLQRLHHDLPSPSPPSLEPPRCATNAHPAACTAVHARPWMRLLGCMARGGFCCADRVVSCRRLYYDPSEPEAMYSTDALMRLIKKIDKDMGP